jgi:M6 family metalloprotease-like protein
VTRIFARLPRDAAVGALIAACTLRLDAQDVEILSHLSGRPLPAGYFARVRENPSFFTWPDPWSPAPQAAARWWTPGWPSATARLAPRTGTLPIVVIPALFADTPSPTFSQGDLQRTLFDGPSLYGTISEVYHEISRGSFAIRGAVVPWVRTSLPLATVLGASNGLGADAKTGDYLREALVRADSLVDFAQFDNNGPDGIPNSADDNGVVDAVVFLYNERSAPCGGQGIWPHVSSYASWTGSPYVTNDVRPGGQAVTIGGYIMLSATECATPDILPPSILAHEIGHVLGLPDLYDSRAGLGAANRRWVVGCWDLMGAGAWGCGSGSANPTSKRPTHMGAWSKDQLGWTAPTVLARVRDQEFVLRAAHRSNDVLRFPIADGEWFDIEFRQRSGYDQELAASGLVVFHVDNKVPVMPCGACAPLYRVMLIEADGNGALLQLSSAGGNRGEAGDVFGDAGRGRFSGATTPSARGRSGAATTLTIHSVVIDETASVARLRVTTDPMPLVTGSWSPATWPALVDETRRLRVNGGALPYTIAVEGTLPTGLAVASDHEDVVVRGVPLRSGAFPVTLVVRDALGTAVSVPLSVTISEPAFVLATLLQPLVQSDAAGPSDVARQYLDVQGNGNGRYDVGDLRAYLRAHPGLK